MVHYYNIEYMKNVIKFTFLIVSVAFLSKAELNMAPFADTLTDLLMLQKYNKAMAYTDSIIAKNPKNTDAHYMRLNIMQSVMLDYESYPNDSTFIGEAEKYLAILKKLKKNCSEDECTKQMLFEGNVIGAIALVQTKQEKWLDGFKNARTSVGLLAKTYKRDTSYYEACLATGVYDYYVGKTFKWVPFVGMREDKGIRQIEKAASRNSIFKFAAIHSLLWILIEQGEHQKADSLVSGLMKHYPNNTILLRIKTRNEYLRKNYDSAMAFAKRLVEVSSKRAPLNWSDMYSGYEVMIRILDERGETLKCQEVVKEALSYNVPESAKKIVYVRDNLEFIGVANMKCINLLAKAKQ